MFLDVGVWIEAAFQEDHLATCSHTLQEWFFLSAHSTARNYS